MNCICQVALVFSGLALLAVAFEEHPDHTTCEGHEIGVKSHKDLEDWPRDKPLKCLWTDGRLASPVINGEKDMTKVSCYIADFLAELHHPEELRALKIYAEDLWAPCFEKHLNDHHRFFFPKLQILHISSLQLHSHGDWFNQSQRLCSVRNLREWVVTAGRFHVTDFRKLPILHHLERWGIEADDIETEPPVYWQLMLEKAPNVIAVHIGGHMRPPMHPHTNLAAKRANHRCPSDTCMGITSLSIDTPRFIFTAETHNELRDLMLMLPSLRSLRLGSSYAFTWLGLKKHAATMVKIQHPLPHLVFHFLDPSANESHVRDKTIEAALEFIEAFPDLSEVQTNARSKTLGFDKELEERLDDSIKHTYTTRDVIYHFGGGPPDLHPPIEETLDDVHTEIAAPSADTQAYTAKEGALEPPSKTGGKVSMNVHPPPKAIKKIVARDASKDEEAPWRHPKHQGTKINMYKANKQDLDTHTEF